MALRPKLNRIWASSNANLRRDPGDAKYIQGWISEIPTYQVLNYLQYKIDTTLLSIAERGIAEWGSDVTYGLASVVWDELDKKIYISSVGAPDKDKAPSTNPAHWVASSIQVSRASYDAITASINAHIANVTGNPHQLTAGRLNAYNKNETDAIFAQYRALVLAHASDKNNPHGVTAKGVGAVPITGGTYTGDVAFAASVKFTEDGVSKIGTTGGLFLQQGNAILGINSAGAVAGTMDSNSLIVTEESFQNLKKSNEPDYAVPREIWRQNLIGDFNVQVGRLNSDFPLPTFDPQYGCWSWTSPDVYMQGNSRDDANNVSPITNSNSVTICCDVLSRSGRNPSDAGNAFVFGIQSAYVAFTGASLMSAVMSDGVNTNTAKSVSYQLTGPINTWYRVAARFDSTGISLFLNGVLVASTTDKVPGNGGSILVEAHAKTAALKRNWTVRNLRVWAQSLSNKQISTL